VSDTTTNNTASRINERHAVMAEANEALAGKIRWITEWYRRDNQHSLIARWDFGDELRDIIEDAKYKNGARYRSGAIRKLARYFGQDESTLRQLAGLAEQFSRAEIERIAGMTLADNITPISYSHVRLLCFVSDRGLREQCLTELARNSWTAEQLSRYIQSLQGTTTNNPNGQKGKAAIPKSLDAVVRQISSFVDDFESRDANVWRSGKAGILAQVKRLQPTEMGEQVLHTLNTARTRITELRGKLEAYEAVFDEALQIVQGACEDKSRPKAQCA
jgi:hypothetical protein